VTSRKIGSAQRDGDNLRTACFQRISHQVIARELSRADQEAGFEFAFRDL
jgi:hypothetical protein